MNNNLLKKSIISLSLTASLILGVGAFSTVAAQNRRQERQRRIEPQRGGQVESTGNIDRNKNGIDDRFETRDGRVDINQNGVADQDERARRNNRDRNYGYYGNRGYGNYGYYGNRGYGNYGYYGNSGYGVNNYDFQRGYRDGFDRGREDALARRSANPNNSSHYRSGNPAYRDGFERGFFEAYRQLGIRR